MFRGSNARTDTALPDFVSFTRLISSCVEQQGEIHAHDFECVLNLSSFLLSCFSRDFDWQDSFPSFATALCYSVWVLAPFSPLFHSTTTTLPLPIQRQLISKTSGIFNTGLGPCFHCNFMATLDDSNDVNHGVLLLYRNYLFSDFAFTCCMCLTCILKYFKSECHYSNMFYHCTIWLNFTR